MQIKTNKITHIFDKGQVTEHVAIKDVSATLTEGEFVTIIGSTGSGKTTYIEHLNALLKPVEGDVTFEDFEYMPKNKFDRKIQSKKSRVHKKKQNIETLQKDDSTDNSKKIAANEEAIKKLTQEAKELESKRDEFVKENNVTVIKSDVVIKNTRKKIKLAKELRSKVGVVFQFAEYQLFEETIMKDIIFGPITMGQDRDKAVENAKKYIEMVGLSQDYLSKSPFALSGGQKRRVALAGILAMEPDFLIFDEPTAGLDPHGEVEMYKIFTELHSHGKTIIIVTHNLNHVLEYSNRTLIFNKASLVADGNSVDLMYDKDLLVKYDLEPPKIADFVWKLQDRGIDVGKVRDIKELASKIGGENG